MIPPQSSNALSLKKCFIANYLHFCTYNRSIEQDFENGLSSTRSWGGSDTFQIFENIGINIMTNAFLTKNEIVQQRQRYNRFRGGGGFHRFGMAKMKVSLPLFSSGLIFFICKLCFCVCRMYTIIVAKYIQL